MHYKPTISGRTTTHPNMRMTWKRALKIERIVRLTIDPAQYTNEQIANHLRVSVATIVLVKQTPQFHSKMLEVTSNVMSDHDAEIRQDTEAMKQELRSMVPSAMMVIRNAVSGRMGPQAQYKASLEVLDRDGAIAKVSRTQVSVTTPPSMVIDASITNNLIALLQSAPTANSDPFTTNSAEALGQQKAMAISNEETDQQLEDIDLSDRKPN